MVGILLLASISQLAQALPQSGGGSNGWQTLPSIAGGQRQEDAVVATQDAIWVVGGIQVAPQFGTVGSVEYFSLSDQAWHNAASFDPPLNHVNAATVNNKVYILGGLSVIKGSDGQESVWTGNGQTMSYAMGDDSWSQLTAMPSGTERGACAVGVHGEKIYLAGGQSTLDINSGQQDALTTVTVYDTSANSWDTNLPPLPQPRQHVAGQVVDDTFYVLGGRTTGQDKVQNSVFALDLTNTAGGWKEMASMPTARGGLACAAVDKKIYCMGGEGDPDTDSYVFPQVEAYDTQTNTWSKLADMPKPRHGWGVAAIGGTIYVPGGGVKGGTAPTDYFDSFTP